MCVCVCVRVVLYVCTYILPIRTPTDRYTLRPQAAATEAAFDAADTNHDGMVTFEEFAALETTQGVRSRFLSILSL